MTTRLYTVTVSATDKGGHVHLDGIKETLGRNDVVSVYRELHNAKETYDWLENDITVHGFYDADDCQIALWASDYIDEADIKAIEERLGHDLDYFTKIGGEIDYKAFVCELMPSEFDRSIGLFKEEIVSCAWDEEC